MMLSQKSIIDEVEVEHDLSATITTSMPDTLDIIKTSVKSILKKVHERGRKMIHAYAPEMIYDMQ